MLSCWGGGGDVVDGNSSWHLLRTKAVFVVIELLKNLVYITYRWNYKQILFDNFFLIFSKWLIKYHHPCLSFTTIFFYVDFFYSIGENSTYRVQQIKLIKLLNGRPLSRRTRIQKFCSVVVFFLIKNKTITEQLNNHNKLLLLLSNTFFLLIVINSLSEGGREGGQEEETIF